MRRQAGGEHYPAATAYYLCSLIEFELYAQHAMNFCMNFCYAVKFCYEA